VVAASVQYTVNRETRDVHLQSTSAKTRNAVLHALDNMRMPPHLSRMELIATFSETFRIILPDTPNIVRRNSSESLVDENEIDAIEALCARLNDRHREISLARRTWDLLKPLESNIDTINIERHLPTQFRLAPQTVDTRAAIHSGYGNIPSAGGQRSFQPEPSTPYHGRSLFQGSNSLELYCPEPKVLLSPVSPGFYQELHMPRHEPAPSDISVSIEGAVRVDTNRIADDRRVSNGVMEPPFFPDFVIPGGANQPRLEHSSSVAPSGTISFISARSTTLAAPPEKGKSRLRPKFPRSRKDSAAASGDTSSLSSTILECQRLEEISLKNLTSVPKKTVRGKSVKNINVYLSQNSTYALFWTQASVHIWDVGASPLTLRRAISTESTCILAAVTESYLVYIIGTRDQKLTVRLLKAPVGHSFSD
jgi:hypothetical protein